MKKIIVVLVLGVLILTSCEEKKKTDYSKYPFTEKNWTRTLTNDTETIRFNADGSFSYSCACGNPVNNSDLCETYTYNEDTKEIKLDCSETPKDTITTIKVVSLTDKTLELDFNGKLRIFEKENN